MTNFFKDKTIASVAQWSKRYSEDIDMGVQFSPEA